MNRRLLGLTIKGIARRWKNTAKVSLAVIFSFLFVTGILLLQENMYNWQMLKAKEHFGNWFVMDVRTDKTENEAVSTFAYLDNAVTAVSTNEIYDEYDESTGVRVGNMSSEFIRQNNITVEQGRLPANSGEIAVDWNSLTEINQGYEIGDEITLTMHTKEGSSFEKTYTLSGILTSYTNIWVNGQILPGVLVHEDELESVKCTERTIYCYPLKSYIREDNYSLIYERICANAKVSSYGTYNSAVYDLQPWGNKLLYRYMYVLMMIIGVASICYQVLSYNRERIAVRKIHKNVGATKGQIFAIYFIENACVIFVSACLGTMLAILAGKIICDNILSGGSIAFYTVGTSTMSKVLLTFVIAVAFSGVVYIFTGNTRTVAKTRIKSVKKRITRKNFIRETSKRFIRNNGFLVNFSVRAFGLIMAAVMIFCAVSARAAYEAYADNNSSMDLIGYSTESNSTSYYYYYQRDPSKKYYTNSALELYDNTKREDTSDSYYELYEQQIEMNRLIKCGTTSPYVGLSDSLMRDLSGVNGVESISFGYFETTRSWKWDDIDLETLGAADYNINSGNNTKIDGKYLFASEYTDFGDELYELIKQYCGDVPLDELRAGKASIVFVDTNRKGVYDDTIKDGTTINLMEYPSFINQFSILTPTESFSLYYDATEKLLRKCFDYYDTNISIKVSNLQDYWLSRLTREDVLELFERSDDFNVYWRADESERYEAINALIERFKNGEVTLEDLYNYADETDYDEDGNAYNVTPIRNRIESLYFDKVSELHYNTPAASTQAGKVVVLTDEIKEAFKEYIPDFGQYTLLASTNLLSEALESQNETLRQFLLMDELPDDVTLKFQPTQVSVTYGLGSTFVSTNNIVTAFLKQAGFECKSYSEQKDQLKEKTVEAILLYGFSGLASLVIYILISLVILMNRLEKNRTSLDILAKTGASRSVRVKICMIECLRESLWCIVVFPLSVLIGYLTVRSRV